MELILIKRYPNRRLYNTQKSAYITLDELADDICSGCKVKVEDSKTGEDLTQRVMIQALLTDRYVHKIKCLPTEFLRTLIQLDDPSMRALFEHYVRMTLSSFTVAQNAMQQNLELFKRLAPGPAELLSGLSHLLSGRKEDGRNKNEG